MNLSNVSKAYKKNKVVNIYTVTVFVNQTQLYNSYYCKIYLKKSRWQSMNTIKLNLYKILWFRAGRRAGRQAGRQACASMLIILENFKI